MKGRTITFEEQLLDALRKRYLGALGVLETCYPHVPPPVRAMISEAVHDSLEEFPGAIIHNTPTSIELVLEN